MTRDEENAYRRESAALILASMLAGYVPPKTPAPFVVEDSEPEQRKKAIGEANAKKRSAYELDRNEERATLAMEAFSFAAALASESVIWEGPSDDEGNLLDPRAFDRECTHGKKTSEDCPDCDREHAAQEAAKGEKPADLEGDGNDAS